MARRSIEETIVEAQAPQAAAGTAIFVPAGVAGTAVASLLYRKFGFAVHLLRVEQRAWRSVTGLQGKMPPPAATPINAPGNRIIVWRPGIDCYAERPLRTMRRELIRAQGLRNEDLQIGDGPIAERGARVTIRYTGYLNALLMPSRRVWS